MQHTPLLPHTRITGTGSHLPARCESNLEIAERLAQLGVETSDEWIQSRTGITQRYLASNNEYTSDLAVQAAQKALQAAKLAASDIDLIIVATTTPDSLFPSVACTVQQKLGALNQVKMRGAAFDVQAVCSGFIYALTTANALIKQGVARKALVIGAETLSSIIDWKDRNTCVLFGDGAGAVVLEASETAGILACKIHADGSLNTILNAPARVHQGLIEGKPFLYMDGQAVFKQAVTVLSEVAQEVCEAAQFNLSTLNWLIPHQANVRILSAVSKRLGISEDKVIVTVPLHANTSAASVPLALDIAVRDGRIQMGDSILLQGVGGGFTWGAVLLRL
jgi:3-oxoacyl-[acyl-carrier-protein] synthase III